MQTRRNFRDLSRRSKDRIIRAILHMKNGPTDTYQKYVDWHRLFGGQAHRGIVFLAWHRIYITLFEQDLIRADRDLGNNDPIALPYWKWYLDSSPDGRRSTGYLWNDRNDGIRDGLFISLGGDGDPNDNFRVTTGPFKGTGTNWIVRPPVGIPPVANMDFTFLRRELGTGAMPRPRDVRATLRLTAFDVPNFDIDTIQAPGTSFRNICEGAQDTADGDGGGMHDTVHVWIGGSGGTMAFPPVSPNDPSFWFHHCNVDRIWEAWQRRHRAVRQYPLDFEIDAARAILLADPDPAVQARADVVRRETDPLPPWDGTGATPEGSPSSLSISTRDVLSPRSLGGALAGQEFRYDSYKVR